MTWIRLNQSLCRHPKTNRFAARMNMSRHEAIGVLVDLWCYCVDYAEDGDISGFTSEELVRALQIGPASVLIQTDLLQALEESGLLDRNGANLQLHDWADYQGQLIHQREASRARQRRYRERNKPESATVTRDVTLNGELGACVTDGHNGQTNEQTAIIPSSSLNNKEIVLEFKSCEPVLYESVERWRALFPDVNVAVEIEAMKAWLPTAQPSKLPKSLTKFGLNWLKREQEKATAETKEETRMRERNERQQKETAAFMEDIEKRGGASKVAIEEAKRYMFDRGFNARTKRRKLKDQ